MVLGLLDQLLILLTVVYDRIARAFNSSGATRAVALDISKAFDRVWTCWSSPQDYVLFILGPTLSLLYINDLPDDVICNIVIYAVDTTLYSICDQTSDLWQELELASELQSDLDTVDWGRKWLFDFNAGKTQLVSFVRCNNVGAIDVRTNGSVLEKISSFRMLGLSFSSKLDLGLLLFLCC